MPRCPENVGIQWFNATAGRTCDGPKAWFDRSASAIIGRGFKKERCCSPSLRHRHPTPSTRQAALKKTPATMAFDGERELFHSQMEERERGRSDKQTISKCPFFPSPF